MSVADAPVPVLERFRPLFEPQTVAVVGASPEGAGPGNQFLRHLRGYGYRGSIYPIHPSAPAVEGLPAYPTLAATPQAIDYAYVAIGAERVPGLIAAAQGRVRFAQIMASGFGEIEAGRPLQDRLLAAARAAGVRLLGPNCMGTHSPRGRLTFVDGAEPKAGRIGVLAQSGGLSIDILRRGRLRGVGFSALVSLGNSVDLGPCDLLEFLLADDETAAIGLYLEDVANGRRLFELLRAARAAKPLVLLKGGRTPQGQRAAASHTGALAGNDRIWSGLARQTGMAMVETLDEFLDALLAFQTLVPNPAHATHKVVLFGNGGGSSVLAADGFARRGFDVAPLNPAAIDALEGMRLPAGSSVANPIDVPASALRHNEGRRAAEILAAIVDKDPPDALVMHINLPVVLAYTEVDILGNLMHAALELKARSRTPSHFLLVLRADGEPEIEARRRVYVRQAIAAGIPVFAELVDAAKALSALRDVERFRSGLRQA